MHVVWPYTLSRWMPLAACFQAQLLRAAFAFEARCSLPEVAACHRKWVLDVAARSQIVASQAAAMLR